MVMALELVGGAALGVVFSELYGIVKDMLGKGCTLKSRLEGLNSELNCWAPMVEQIIQLSNTVGHPTEETEALIQKMEGGKNLVNKCLNSSRSIGCGLNPCKTSKLEDELRKLEEAIRKFFQTYIPLYMARIGLEDLAVSNVIKAKVDLVANNGSQGLQFLEALQTSVDGVQTSVNSLQTNLNDMQTGVQGVETKVNGVQTSVNSLQTSLNDMQTGVQSVETTVNGVQIDMQTLVNALRTIVIGMQIDMWTRITNVQTSVQALHQAQNLGARNVGVSCGVPLLPQFIIGSGEPLEEVKKRLLDEKISPLVLTGPGGWGKTALAIRFGHDPQIKDVFKENIFFITVSPAPEIISIARDLFAHLGRSAPEFQSDEHAICQVGLLLGKIGSPILLIMDNVWPTSEHLVMKFKFNIRNYHILVTSVTAIEENKSVYTLPPLDDEHAMKLLRHSAVLKDEGNLIPEECIKKILRDCEGNALALVEIGLSFRGKPPEAWQSWVMDRSAGHLVLDSCGELLKRSQEILRCLDDKAMECFLDLGLFPVGQRIPLVVLIEIWTVLYKLDRARGISILNQISSHNLAHILSIYECYYGADYSGYFVEQHNLLKELAIHQSNQGPIGQRKRLILPISENKSLDSQSEKELLYIKARSLSITIDEKFSSSQQIIQPSEIEVLVLNFQLGDYQLLEFVKKMEKLKVLIVTNYGFPCGVKQESWSAPVLKKIILENRSTSLAICCIGQASGNCDIKISDGLPNTVEIHMGSCCYLVELPVGAFGRSASNCSQVADELVAARTVRLKKLPVAVRLKKIPVAVRQQELAFIKFCRNEVLQPVRQAVTVKLTDLRSHKTIREFARLKHMVGPKH